MKIIQNKKERINQIRRGGPSVVDTGGFLFVQDEKTFVSDFGFRYFYGIFYISNRNLKNIGRGDWSRPCSVGRD